MSITYTFGAHEPLRHRLRTGNAATDERERYAAEVSDDALERAVRAGATSVHVACYKGFGLSFEQDTMARAADFALRARERGLGVSVYVQGPVVYDETFLIESPEAEDWLVKNQFGKTVTYSLQTFRHHVCVNAEDFLRYQEEMLRAIVERVRPDAVFMDNVSLTPPPNDCHCWHCQEAFRAYLQEKLGERLEEETGLPSVERVAIPECDVFHAPPDAIRRLRDPVFQEYLLFRIDSLARYMRRMRATVKRLDPRVTFGVNAGCDPFRVNLPFTVGQWFEVVSRCVDSWTVEEAVFRPRVEADGRVVTKARVNKVGEFCGKVVRGGFWGERDIEDRKVTLAEVFAFGRGEGAGGFNLAQPFDEIEPLLPVYRWARAIEEKIGAGDIYAPVATARLLRSQAFVRYAPMAAACMAEQALFEAHVPFVIATDSLFQRLDEFDAVLLPETPALSDEEIAALRKYVEGGGGLVLIGEAAAADERLRPRVPHPFLDAFPKAKVEDLLEMGPPHWVPNINLGRLNKPLKGRLGDGRVVWMPRLTPEKHVAYARDPYWPFRVVLPEEVVPPKEAKGLLKAVKWVRRKPALVEVEGPKHLLAEFRRTEDRLFVHLANLSKEKPARQVKIILREEGTVRATAYPMEKKAKELKPRKGKAGPVLTLPAVERYTLVEIAAWGGK